MFEWKSWLAGLAGLAATAVLAAGIARAADDPTELRIAGILTSGVENAWEKSFIDSFERVKAEKPHGLDISMDYTENVGYDEAEQVMRAYADTGEYDIIFSNSSYSDAVERLMEAYPDTMFVVSGSGNRGLGGNAYWIFIHAHEPAYLMGMIAGRMTKSDVIGVVGLFPAADVNDQINAYFQGARDVNPEVERKVTFIQSWYDPPKSQAATAAQVAAGADFIFQIAPTFETCEQKNIGCFGNYADFYELAPEAVVTSAIVKWDPHLEWLIDEWWKHETTGAAYNAPKEPKWFSMAEGGSELAPYHAWESKIPDEVKTLVAETKAKILSGEKTVELDVSLPKSD